MPVDKRLEDVPIPLRSVIIDLIKANQDIMNYLLKQENHVEGIRERMDSGLKVIEGCLDLHEKLGKGLFEAKKDIIDIKREVAILQANLRLKEETEELRSKQES